MPNSTLAQMGFLDEDTQQEAVYDLEDTQARSDISTINGKIPSTASSSNKMATASDITDINNKIPSNASSSNKLATISDVSAAYKPKGNATLATLPSLTAEHLNWVYNMTEDFTTTSDFAEGAGKSVKAGNEVGIIDVSTTSTPSYKYTVLGGFVDTSSLQPKTLDTPVEVGGVNRTTVEAALGALANDKEDTILAATPLVKEYDEIMHQEVLRLNQDDAPTNNSNNPVKSGGIYTALADKASKANVIANTKLIKDTVGWSGKNLLPKQNSATLNGITFIVNSDDTVTVNGTATARAEFVYLVTSRTDYSKYAGKDVILTGCPAGGAIGTYFLGEWDSTQNNNRNDYGEGVRFTFPTEKPSDFNLKIRIENGQTISNLVFKPMLREATILDDTYEAPHESVKDTLREAEVIEGKNLLENKAITQTYNGITFSVNADKSVSVYGTATANSYFNIYGGSNYAEKNIYKGKKLSGCPAGGSGSSYGLVAQYWDTPTHTDGTNIQDIGNGTTIGNNTEYLRIYIRVENGTNMGTQSSPKVFYPMIREVTETDPTYEPYYVPLKDSMFRREEQRMLGAKNLLDVTLATTTKNGVTATVNNGVISTSGTSDAEWVQFEFNHTIALKAGKYILSGITGGSVSTYRFSVSGTVVEDFSLYDGEQEFTITSDGTISVSLYVREANVDMSGKVFYPMIRLASDPDDTYAPYAMTNKELTEKVNGMVDYVNTTANNGNAYTGSLDDAPLGFAYCSSGCTNNPVNKWGVAETIKASSTAKIQKFYSVETDDFYIRRMLSSVWQAWQKVTTTSVS